MNGDTFELALVTALRDEAQEIAMSTDINEGRSTLDHNLDKVDAGRRRRVWITGVVAVAAVAAVIALVLGVTRPSAAPPPAGRPTATPEGFALSSATFATDTGTFSPQVSMVLPAWASTADQVSGLGLISLTQVHGCAFDNTCTDDADNEIFVMQPFAQYTPPETLLPTQSPTAQQVVDGWHAAQTAGMATVTDESTGTVGGKPATFLTVVVSKQIWGMIGCDNLATGPTECVPSPPGRTTRVAVVDTGEQTPTVFYLIRDADNPQTAGIAAQLDSILSTVTFG